MDDIDALDTCKAAALARLFDGQDFAFVAVLHDHESPDGKTRAALGIAVANLPGYIPLPQFYYAAARIDDAESKADSLNAAKGVTTETAMLIQISTMGGKRYAPAAEIGA